MKRSNIGVGYCRVIEITLDYLGINAIRPIVLSQIIGGSPNRAGRILRRLKWDRVSLQGTGARYTRSDRQTDLDYGVNHAWIQKQLTKIFGKNAPRINSA